MHTHSHCLWIRADWAASELRPQHVTQGHSADYSHKITRCSSRSYQLLCLVTATPEFYLVFSPCLFSWWNDKSFWVTGPRALDFTFGNVWRKMKGSRLRGTLVLIPTSHRFHSWLSLFSPSQGRNPFFLEPSVIITITDGNKLTHSSGVSDEVRTAEWEQRGDVTKVRPLVKVAWLWRQSVSSLCKDERGTGSDCKFQWWD